MAVRPQTKAESQMSQKEKQEKAHGCKTPHQSTEPRVCVIRFIQ